ncbi:glycosyltransferase [Marinobacter sp. BSs20148]|jgi:glycosyltransferase involved in cell wall biosynthesis|uniref:glycosyltransferase n=1 Tax=Marinobacter sp. BSs20148 TaxID=490759 RepID=UPI0002776D55|nr:glycosyltransferase [Marinobacter sp. BSs20148]AFP31141.1 Lipopolysaccharide core biosynthesis glycosyltransferase lpsE [Marinobacter sp. BSs20148]
MSIRVLQFICPTGYYGAERWINALVSANADPTIEYHIAITDEAGSSDEVLKRSALPDACLHRLKMASKFDFLSIFRLAKLLRDLRIDVIHTHGYKSDILGISAAKLAGVRSVCTPHGFENAEDRRLKAYMWLGGKAFHGFDWVCPLSEDIEKTVVEQYGVNTHRVQLINNGVDLSEVEAAIAAPKARETSEFRIGYIGQLISRKNLAATVSAFDVFYQQNQNARLILIGDGDRKANLMGQVAELGLASAVEFLGFRDDRLAFLPTFDAFVLTSSLEGVPRCLMEAMAANVCVTAFDIPGVDVLIKPDQTGLLIPYGDTSALAQAWANLAQSPEIKTRLASAGRTRIYDSFSASAMAEIYGTLFKNLVPEPAAGQAAKDA